MAEKVLYLIDSANLETLAADDRPPIEAGWRRGSNPSTTPMSDGTRPPPVAPSAITDQPEVAERLDLLGINAFVVGSRSSVLDLARIHAQQPRLLRADPLAIASSSVPCRNPSGRRRPESRPDSGRRISIAGAWRT